MNSEPQIIIASDASMKGWGANCQGQRTGRLWSKQKAKKHMNILELKTAKFAILTFTKILPQAKIIHFQMSIAKMGGIHIKLDSGHIEFMVNDPISSHLINDNIFGLHNILQQVVAAINNNGDDEDFRRF